MNKDWKEVKLDDICEFVNKKISINNINKTNYISTENMLPNKNGIINSINLPRVEVVSSYEKHDILISNIRPYFKKIWYATFSGGCSNDVLVFRTKKDIYSKFLYYILSNNNFFEYATKTSKGTKMPRGDKVAIMQYNIQKIPLSTQKKIASILSALDDKIELNNKINENLEEQAKALFNKNLKENDYRTELLIDIANIKYGKGLPTNKLTKSGYYVFGGNGIIGYYNDYLYELPQIIISCRGAASGNVLESYPFSYITNNSLILELKDRRYYEFIKKYLLQNQLQIYATGSAQPQITIENLSKVRVPYPSFNKIENISNILESFNKKIFSNKIENSTLSSLRDTLLPKLMSGEIDVENVKIY